MDYSRGPFSQRVEKLLDTFAKDLEGAFDYTSDLPKVLWHYTSAEGLRAIVESNRLRLSHARFLNDPTEIAFGWTAVTAALDEAIDNATNLKPFFVMTKAVAGEVYHAEHYFTFCLSEREDSLSQWRAYGGDGEGYALGFDSSRMLRCTEPDVTGVLLKMKYSESDQSKMLNFGIDTAKALWKELLDGDVPREHRLGIAHRANLPLSRFMLVTALSLKHASFEDEKEWRLVTGLHPDEAESISVLKKVGFRSGASIVKPFLDLPFEPSDTTLPITRIMFGPTLRPALTRESLEFFLARRGYANVSVERSTVPLQA